MKGKKDQVRDASKTRVIRGGDDITPEPPAEKSIDDMSKDELIAALVNKGINPLDSANKTELKKQLKEV